MLIAIASVSACLLSGCSWSIGGGKKEGATVHQQATRGQELMDLKKARDQGAISEDEYQKEKNRILSQ